MTDNHPITPPPDLLHQWATEYWGNPGESIGEGEKYIAIQAARWGADQELEACCEWLGDAPVVYNDNDDLHPGSYLRDARRPKPPSLKEQAMAQLQTVEEVLNYYTSGCIVDTIRRALESLDD